MSERDSDTSPGEAQNSGPPHRTPPGPQDRSHGSLRPDTPPSPEPPGGEPEVRDDR